MIPSLLQPLPLPAATQEDPEDIFSANIGSLFRDETRDQHGVAGSGLIYTSTTYGDIYLALFVPDPESVTEKRLFAHFIWNAGLLLAEMIGVGVGGSGSDVRRKWRNTVGWEDVAASRQEEDIEVCMADFWGKNWNELVRGSKVLELGAGSGVLSLVCHLAGAREVVCTDYPTNGILECIKGNIARNVVARKDGGEPVTAETAVKIPNAADQTLAEEKIRVLGHKWGCFDDEISRSGRQKFDLVIAADVLWIDDQHESLLSSFEYFLTYENKKAEGWIIAGFHTGREKIAGFVELVNRRWEAGQEANANQDRLLIRSVLEVDVSGTTRSWESEREESITERKKWLVMIVLKRVGR